MGLEAHHSQMTQGTSFMESHPGFCCLFRLPLPTGTDYPVITYRRQTHRLGRTNCKEVAALEAGDAGDEL